MSGEKIRVGSLGTGQKAYRKDQSATKRTRASKEGREKETANEGGAIQGRGRNGGKCGANLKETGRHSRKEESARKLRVWLN